MHVNNQPLISIIVPVYKVEKYLKKCVDSILAQTYRNIEVILVDDGSPDNCPGICEEYSNKDSRIVVIHKENGGLSDARNAGLDIAQGEYISFVDSDDYVASNMCEVLLNAAQINDADVALCNYARVNEDYEEIENKVIQKYAIDKKYSREEFIHELIQPYGGYYVVVWNKLYRKSIFQKLRFPVGKQHEDEFIIHYIVDRSAVIISVKATLYYYLQRKESIMGMGFSVKSMDYGEALIDRYHYTKSRKYNKWKDHIVLRLSYEFDKWKKYAIQDCEVKKRYEELRRKSIFLIFERAAWSGNNITLRGKIFLRFEHIFPVFAGMIRKVTRKGIK